MNPQITALAKGAAPQYGKGRVEPQDILAVIERETGGKSFFSPTEPLYIQNLNSAIELTGLPKATLEASLLIDHGPNEGQPAKFRCEPAYWTWAKGLDPKVFTPGERFLMSCSFGLGQKMARWLCAGLAPDHCITYLRAFMAGEDEQIRVLTQDLSTCFALGKSNKALGFAIYNGGPSVQVEGQVYMDYGVPVSRRAQQIGKLLEQNHY